MVAATYADREGNRLQIISTGKQAERHSSGDLLSEGKASSEGRRAWRKNRG